MNYGLRIMNYELRINPGEIAPVLTSHIRKSAFANRKSRSFGNRHSQIGNRDHSEIGNRKSEIEKIGIRNSDVLQASGTPGATITTASRCATTVPGFAPRGLWIYLRCV